MRYFFLVALLGLKLFATDTEILSSTKQQIIELQKKQIEEKSNSNKYDWLSDITINSSISKDQDDLKTTDYSLSINQDIFRFGGISSQIDYANELKKMETLDLDISTKDDLNTLFSLLIDIQLNNISLEQNNLNIQNSEIDIKNKQSEYKAGELGISDLNEAIMTKNELRDTNRELKLTKLTNINSVKKYTSKNYSNILIPELSLISKDIFLQNSIAIKYAKSDINVNNSLYKIKRSDYLPSISLDAKYGYNETDTSDENNYYNYGLSISMPLSFTSSSSIEQTKIDYLISKQNLNEEINNTSLIYDEAILTIDSYKDRINLAKDDIKLYNELLQTNTQEYKAGYKTIDDVQTIKNSKKIRELDIQKFQLNIKKQILSLYFQI